MAIPKPKRRDWIIANAEELRATDREVLAMLREAHKRVVAQLEELVKNDSPNISAGVRRAQLEQTRALLLAEQSDVFERLGDIVSARRLRSAARAQRLSAAGDAALLALVGKGAEGQFLYESALQASQKAIDTALARMKLSALPLSQRIYRSSVWMDSRLGKLINETLATGLNAKEFAKRARDWFSPSTPGGVRYAAMRLARTEINNAFHATSAQKYAETPWVTEVEWNLSGSHPKRDECNELADDSPFKSDNVPARPHPQCMCYITPKSIDEDEFVENFLKGDYDDYLDAELEKNGWQVEEPPPVLTPKPKAKITNDDVDDEFGDDDFWNAVSKRMDEVKANPPPPVVKRRVKPVKRPDGAKIAGHGRVEAPAVESDNVKQLGYRMSDKIPKRIQAKAKRVAAIAETHIGDGIKRIALLDSGIPPSTGHKAETTFALAYYDSGIVHLHSGFDKKADTIAGCVHSHHFVHGGDDAHETVLAHEFGHVFLSKNRLSLDALNSLLHTISDALELPAGVKSFTNFRDRDAALRAIDNLVNTEKNAEAIKAKVSSYARKNGNEFLAEIWAEYTMNPDASPAVRKIGDLMAEYIRGDKEGLSARGY